MHKIVGEFADGQQIVCTLQLNSVISGENNNADGKTEIKDTPTDVFSPTKRNIVEVSTHYINIVAPDLIVAAHRHSGEGIPLRAVW